MASEVSICNQALGWLGSNSITSLNDASKEAILCKANYEELRDAVLGEGAWTFATVRLAPAPDSSAPTYGYSYSFSLSSTIITVLEVQEDKTVPNGANDLDWRFEGGAILCDAPVIYVKAIKQITDPKKYHPLFVQALAARLAADLAIPLTQNRRLQADLYAIYQEKLDSAMFIDGSQGRRDRLRARQYQQVR